MNLPRHGFSVSILAVLVTMALRAAGARADAAWSPDQAHAWAGQTPWLVGANFSPSTAINELEMWQAESFDPTTIDRELGWAHGLSFNCVRVFLHDLPWDQDSKSYLERIDQFLAIADKHQVRVMFVLFDSCWDPFPKLGAQRAPRPGVHNSGWVQSPGAEKLKDPARREALQAYVKGVVGRFKDDKRVVVWDVYNEPDNLNDNSYGPKNLKQEPADKLDLTLPLLKAAFTWAREAGASQPLTSAVWTGDWNDPNKLTPIQRVQIEQTDVISFHMYASLEETRRRVESLRRYGRPLICTEYMARPQGSHFDPVLGYLKDQKVGAFNWGFVSGKTQTIYPWDSWQHTYTAEPKVWFHDIFRADGTPFDPAEVAYIRKVNGALPQ